jgi:Zn-dependent protease
MSGPRPRTALERLRDLERAESAAASPRSQRGGGASPPLSASSPERAPATPQRRWGRALAGAGSGLLLLAWKLKGLLLFALSQLKWLLIGLKMLSFGKFATTFATMGLMVWTYSWFFGFGFSFGLVLLILIHELGHGAAARWLGFRVGAPVFVPFFGAFIALRDRVRTTYQDFVIGAGGPVAGTAGGVAALLLARTVPAPTDGLLYAVGYFSLVINLFNLLPIGPLDGGRMTAPVTPLGWVIGGLGLALVLVHAAGVSGHAQPIAVVLVLVVVVMAVRALWRRARGGNGTGALARLAAADARDRARDEPLVTPGQRRVAATVYFGLAAVLVHLTHVLAAGLPRVNS